MGAEMIKKILTFLRLTLSCQSGSNKKGRTNPVWAAAAFFIAPLISFAGTVNWAHHNGSLASNGAIVVKALSGGSYSGTQNPTGSLAKANQNAVTQPPTVLIQGGSTRGEVAYTIPGTYSWQAPIGVTSVSVVCVGGGGASKLYSGAGGGLAYKNDIPVVGGTLYTVVIGAGGQPYGPRNMPTENGGDSYFKSPTTVRATGGTGANVSAPPGGTMAAGDGGGSGGIGYVGGGGAAGYSGNGGSGSIGTNAGMNGTGGAAGGGGGNYNAGGGGGGVGLYGTGAIGVGGDGSTGTGPYDFAYGGGAGSGGSAGGDGSNNYGYSGAGGNYGGGAGYGRYMPGGNGACRIIWPGSTRKFPSTDVGPS